MTENNEKGMAFRFFNARVAEEQSGRLWVCLPSVLKNQKNHLGYIATEGGTSYISEDCSAELSALSRMDARRQYGDALVDKLCMAVCKRANDEGSVQSRQYERNKRNLIGGLKKACSAVKKWNSLSEKARDSRVRKTESIIRGLVEFLDYDDSREILAALKLGWNCYSGQKEESTENPSFPFRESIDKTFRTAHMMKGRDFEKYIGFYIQITEKRGLEDNAIDYCQAYLESFEGEKQWQLPKMLIEFAENSSEYKLARGSGRTESEATRTNLDSEESYSLQRGGKDALVLKINTNLMDDQYGMAVPGSLPKVAIELMDSGLRNIYNNLVDLLKKKE